MIQKELGPAVLKKADEIQFLLNTYQKADATEWRDLLQALFDGAGEEAMSSPLGMAIQTAIQGRIQNDNGASVPRQRRPRGGFPQRRQ